MSGPRCTIDLVFPGRTSCAYLKKGEDDYLKRLSRYAEIGLRPVKAGRSSDGSDRSLLESEAREILKKIRPQSLVVVLDQRGREATSEEFAAMVDRWRHDGRPVSVVIGGHLGLAEAVRERADVVVAISRMTFTHEMARLFVLEQIYRAFTILAGSEYHK